MDGLKNFVDNLRTYDEGSEPADGWYIAYDDLQKAAAILELFIEVSQEFCDRCDSGEVFSKYTYAKFKAILDSEGDEA